MTRYVTKPFTSVGKQTDLVGLQRRRRGVSRQCGCQAKLGQRSSGTAPELRDTGKQQAGSSNSKQNQQQQQPSIKLLSPSLAKILYKRTLKSLASLPLAIGELFLLAGLSAIGTIIEQNKSVQFYQDAYPSGANKVLGFLTYHWIYALQWDHIYTAPYFLGLMALLGASLAACTSTRQLPMVRVARRWRFAQTPERIYNQGSAEVLPDADVKDLGRLLSQKGYQVFRQGPSLYAFKGLAGRLGPIGVHASMLAIMAGVAIGGLGGFKGSVMVPEGGDFLVAQALAPNSPAGSLPAGAKQVLHVNSFNVDYRPDGSVQQFKSDLSVFDLDGREKQKKTISVNQPIRFDGVTAYQTDWSIAAVTLHAQGSPLQPDGDQPFNLPMASLEGQPGVSGQAWATYIPAERAPADGSKPRGASIFARDFQTVVIYDTQGKFVGVRRPGSGLPIQVEGMSLVIDDLVGSTGLELKVDPGVPYVYAGFAGLMITTLVSYLSHSQIWALQEEGLLHIGGRTNRATLAFAGELSNVLDQVPDQGSGKKMSSKGQQGSNSVPAAAAAPLYVAADSNLMQQAKPGAGANRNPDYVPNDTAGNINGSSIGFAGVDDEIQK